MKHIILLAVGLLTLSALLISCKREIVKARVVDKFITSDRTGKPRYWVVIKRLPDGETHKVCYSLNGYYSMSIGEVYTHVCQHPYDK